MVEVFKAYDIRGLSPEQINAAFARRLGKALAVLYPLKKVMVGRDMRTTSYALEAALIDGLTSSGVNVVRIGLCSTPMFNVLLGLANKQFDLGVMVTASHNPGKYNGFKLALGDCTPIGEKSGMEQVAEAFAAGKEKTAEHIGTVIDDPTGLERYIEHIIDLSHLPGDMPRMRVAIDAGNGMAGAILPRLLSKLPWLEAVPLYFDPDGSFPNHEANPLKVETLDRLRKIVKTDGCVMGVAFDGDADRVGFVDEKSIPLPGDLTTALLAEEMLKEHPGGLIHYDVRSSWAVPEAIAESGGRAEICKVGHANIKKLMRETGAVFSGEVSMHFYFSELWNCESGDLAMLLLLRRMAREGTPLSLIWKPLQRYVHSPEINFEVSDQRGIMNRLEALYKPKSRNFSKLDGIRVEFADWWFNVRASNTEPLLRLNAEARTEEELNAHIEELSEIIRGLPM
jgi:phosphomannomutase